MTADHPTREEQYAAVLEVHMGCGPGEILTETVGADTDGGPGEIAVGQTCCSSAHNYAYWNGTCQFASNLAAALVAADPAPAQPDAAPLCRCDHPAVYHDSGNSVAVGQSRPTTTPGQCSECSCKRWKDSK